MLPRGQARNPRAVQCRWWLWWEDIAPSTQRSPQISSGCIWIAPAGHSVTHRPQPLQ